MIISKEYTVISRLADLAGLGSHNVHFTTSDDSNMFVHSIIVEDGEQAPHPDVPIGIYVGSKWLQNNLTDEEMAQWAALRLLGKLDKPTTCKDKFNNITYYGGEALLPLKRGSDGKLGVSQKEFKVNIDLGVRI